MQDTVYTLENQLDKVLAVLPRERGDLFYVRESVWQEANPDYEKVVNRKRKGHFGLISTSLSAAHPLPIRTHHGHSRCHGADRWYHLAVQGMTREDPERKTYFDLLHAFGIPWKRFFRSTEAVSRNLSKPHLDDGELSVLDHKEHQILSRMQHNYDGVLEAYQRNPAWRNRFPGIFGEQSV